LIVDYFAIGTCHLVFCRAVSGLSIGVNAAAERFGRTRMEVSWQAAWRTWVRRAVDYGGGGPGPPGRPAQNRPLSYAEALKRAVNSEPDLAEPKFDLDLTATDITPTP
jgi:hypothetical protein